MKTIEELKLKDIVIQDSELSYVAECGHGTKYYAYIGSTIAAEICGHDTNEAIEVCDMSEDMLIDCCG